MSTIISGDSGITTASIDLTSGQLSVADGGTGTATGENLWRNKIINGAMMIDQRNAGASVTPTADNTYTLDRWAARLSAASKFSVQQSTTAPAGFINSLKVTSLSAYTLGAGDFFTIQQAVEGLNVSDLGWGTANAQAVTISFKVYSSLTGTFGGSVLNSAGNRSYPFTYTISSANTWTTISVTIAGDTGGTWLTTNGIGVQIWFGLGVGSTYSGAAGSWSGSTYFGATGATSVVGTNGATFYITGIQLEKGSTATSFEYRPYGTELALCQRYYEKSYDISVVPGTTGATFGAIEFTTGIAGSAAGSVAGLSTRFATAKRAAPTMTAYDTISGTINTLNGLVNTGARSGTVTPTIVSNTNQFNIDVTVGTSLAGFYGQWTASAEL